MPCSSLFGKSCRDSGLEIRDETSESLVSTSSGLAAPLELDCAAPAVSYSWGGGGGGVDDDDDEGKSEEEAELVVCLPVSSGRSNVN